MYLAQRALVSYVRSVSLMRDKAVFNASTLPIKQFAESLGMPTPTLNLTMKGSDDEKEKKNEKNDNDENEDEDEDEDEEKKLKQAGKTQSQP